MSDTKEKILGAALGLFARDGYEAVSVSTIAAELGITKGALYKHFKNKRDIFDSIVEKMYSYDKSISQENEMPEHEYETEQSAYKNISAESIKEFTLAQFRFWTKDAFAVNYRRMVMLEQYRSAELAELYGASFLWGPVHYMEDVFRTMAEEKSITTAKSPKQLAFEFYAPLGFLINLSDASEDTAELEAMLKKHMDDFFKRIEERLN